MASALLSVEKIPPLEEQARALLDEVCVAGQELWHAYLQGPEPQLMAAMGHAESMMRRWMLETVLVVHSAGEIHYGAIARALGGLPSGSLSPKLRELEAMGFLTVRQASGKRIYRISATAEPFANGVFALTLAKSFHHACVASGHMEPGLERFGKALIATTPPVPIAQGIQAFAKASRTLRDFLLTRAIDDSLESRLATAQRFTEACARKWHGMVMMGLMRGPATYSELREQLGMGDQALSDALASLVVLSAIAKTETGYRLAAFGEFDMAVGMSVLALYVQAVDSSKSA